MKKFTVFIFGILLLRFVGFSQSEMTIDSTGKMMNEQIIIDINLMSWVNYPSEITVKPTSSEFSLSYMNLLFGKKSHFSMNMGLGISTQNVKFDAYISQSASNMPTFQLFDDSITYKKNKLTMVFVDVPLEFRVRTNNNIHMKNFKITFGGKIGYLIKSYHKYVGDEYRFDTDASVRFKEYKVPFLNKIHYSAFAKIFYGKFGFNVNYAFSKAFDTEFKPEFFPISVGISMIFI